MLVPENNEPKKTRIAIDLPFVTIVKVLLVLLLLSFLKVLYPLVMSLCLSSFLAIALAPVVRYLEGKGVKRVLGIALIAILLTALTITLLSFVVPKLFQEFSNFISNLPKLKEHILSMLPEDNPLRTLVNEGLSKQVPQAISIAPIFSAGNVVLDGFTEIILIFVFAIYLLVDDHRAVNWFCAFFNESTQTKLKRTMDEIGPIIFSYVSGQVIASLLSFTYVLIVLSVLQVPNALLLAVLAGLFDVLPVLGFVLSVIPALIFAFSISSSTALIVLLLYLVYHGLENYFIIPTIYGKRLRLSSFTVLLALITAWLLAGIEGAILALPLVASYPIIERIWLKKVVGPSTITEHKNSADKA